MTESDTLIDPLLSDLDAKRAAATALPWADFPYPGGVYEGQIRSCEDVSHIADMPPFDDRPADFAYIVAACNSIPTLLAEIRRLRRERDEATTVERERCRKGLSESAEVWRRLKLPDQDHVSVANDLEGIAEWIASGKP